MPAEQHASGTAARLLRAASMQGSAEQPCTAPALKTRQRRIQVATPAPLLFAERVLLPALTDLAMTQAGTVFGATAVSERSCTDPAAMLVVLSKWPL